jgi:hypothetical protein
MTPHFGKNRIATVNFQNFLKVLYGFPKGFVNSVSGPGIKEAGRSTLPLSKLVDI